MAQNSSNRGSLGYRQISKGREEWERKEEKKAKEEEEEGEKGDRRREKGGRGRAKGRKRGGERLEHKNSYRSDLKITKHQSRESRDSNLLKKIGCGN